MSRRRTPLHVATAAYLLIVGLITLTPVDARSGPGVLRALVDWFASLPLLGWLTFDSAEFLANVALFVPVGGLFALQLGRSRWWLGAVLALALSAAIETAQLLWLPSRVPDLRDLLSNGSGGVLGAAMVPALVPLLRKVVTRRAR